MSRMMRAVQERWSPSTDNFLGHDAVLSVLESAGEHLQSHTETTEYNDVTVFYISDGAAFLDYIESSPAFTDDAVFSFLIDAGRTVTREKVSAFVSNLRSFASSWRSAIDPDDNSLRIYVDYGE